MKYDFHVHDAIRVEYRVATDGPSFPRGYANIERETRSAGGNGVIAACALARWGATVLLSGNALGDDDHGRFLGRELERIPNLTYKPQIDPTKQTPYAILLKAGGHGVGTLLSPSAARVKIHKQVQDNAVAGFFFGDPAGFGEGGESSILGAPTQDYDALLASLEAVATCYLSLLGEEVSPHEKAAFVSFVMEKYRGAFDGPQSIPNMEEIEAFWSNER